MEPNQSNSEDTEIHLSIQGNYFIVEKSLIEAHDWILSKIISSEIPWRKTSDNGQIYLDVDPTSFRIILAILKGTFDISQDADMLPRSDLALLKTTARYLMLDDVYEAGCAFETGIAAEHNAILRKKDQEIIEIKKKSNALQLMAKKYKLIKEKVENLNVTTSEFHAPLSLFFNRHDATTRKSITISSAPPSNNRDLYGNHICVPRNGPLVSVPDQQRETRRDIQNIDHFVDVLIGISL